MHSTETAVTYFADEILLNMDKGLVTGSVFIDLAKAFDTVDHDILLRKLEYYGICEESLLWFKDYFTGRKQFVQIDSHSSEELAITSGVPQGSILGPLLFIVYINDLPRCVKHCSVNMYADDTVLYLAGPTVDNLTFYFNQDLQCLSEWLEDNNLVLNVSKTKSVCGNPKAGVDLPGTKKELLKYMDNSKEKLQCEALIKEFFTQGKLQNYYTCFKKCSKLTEQELQRIKPKSFNHDWVEKLDNWWLCYVEGEGMFCIICKKQGVTNPQNKTDKFSGVASDRFKSDAIETHRKSGRHKSALEVEMISIMSVFHKEFVEKKETEISLLEKGFSTAYFVMKEYLPNREFFLPINLITNVIGVAEIKYFQHRSEGSLTEIVLTIGNVVKELNLKKIRAASCFGLMTDEMTDVSVTSQLITFVQYFCSQSETVETSFLSAQNVLKEHDAATVQAIYDLLKEELLSSQLGIKKFDRAGNRWCICHDTKYIQDVFGLLRQTWKHFENSPKRMELLMKLLTNVNEVRVSSTKGKKVLAKKLKKACKTRWLSFDRSVEAMKQQYCGVIQTLQELDCIHNDATAAGLLKKMKNAEFIGALYYISISSSSSFKSFPHIQRSNINVSLIQPQIKATKQNLNRIVEDDIPMDKLQADVDSFTNLGCDITFPPTSYQQMQSLTQKYIAALSNNLDQRFLSSSDVISALSIFDPVNVPAYEADGFQEYGHSSVNILAKHFFQIETEVQKLKSEKLLAEWSHMKYHVNDNIKKMIPIEVKSGSSIEPPQQNGFFFISLIINLPLLHSSPSFSTLLK
ncbi:putative RNA-directed DNA polymerase from transposon BS [Stylophora pistillata]|uniref:Putative RNA-directed DNA polymerase from transposon BS n=1 Tax=Stylophora pistillata TaxID=50429 RepID=A0A2B4SB73_STYPI|nr:putative RNA-directed DNA polymerase from transposon BS [Stylophora pistillata]